MKSGHELNTGFDQCFHWDGVWVVNRDDELVIDEDYEVRTEYCTTFTAWMEEEFAVREVCLYCSSKLSTAKWLNPADDIGEEERDPPILFHDTGNGPDFAQLSLCPHCAYWQWLSVFENRGQHGSAGVSVLARFDPTVPDGCSSELAQHLRRNENRWFRLDPKGMERLVTDLFRANYRDAEVIHIGRPGDGGTDVIFLETDGHR